jgi:hypothetical protein
MLCAAIAWVFCLFSRFAGIVFVFYPVFLFVPVDSIMAAQHALLAVVVAALLLPLCQSQNVTIPRACATPETSEYANILLKNRLGDVLVIVLG